ncbi:MAG: hypothetical protein JJT78_15530 [Leptospira sp.]|nr:hypothetical protein [Leptospira sp.]
MHLSYLVLTQAFATIFLTGLIWMVQIVHYPSFMDVGSSEFLEFHKNHSTRISLIVVPMMTLELVLAIVILFACLFEQLESNMGANANLLEGRTVFIQQMGWLVWINLIIVILLWITTFFISVPYHNQLGQGFQMESAKKLVQTNWIRTIFWSIKSYVVLRILVLYYNNLPVD